MTTETKVEAVARLEITAHGRGEWSAHESPEGMFVLYAQHASAITALEGEVETCRRLLSEKVSAETMLRELHITPAGLSAQVEGGMAGILMQSIVEQFREIGGPNFFEMKFSADKEQYVLTVQRCAGLTPADKMKAAERRAAELQGVLSDAVGSLYRLDITKLDAGDRHTLDVLLDRLQNALTKETP